MKMVKLHESGEKKKKKKEDKVSYIRFVGEVLFGAFLC